MAAIDSIDAGRAENIRLIADSAAFVAAPGCLARVRASRGTLPGFAREDWQAAADLGWLALRVPVERGGIGLGVRELCALAEQLGAGLAPAPLMQAIATAPLLPDDWLAKTIAGTAVVLPAWQDGDDAKPARLADGAVCGEKRYVPMAAGADAFIIATADGPVLVERDAPGVSITIDQLQDGTHYGTIGLGGAAMLPIAGDFTAVGEEITLALAAYLLGAMRRVFELTKDYLGTRQQFGKPIGSFQSLQHRMVDLYIQIELTGASVRRAAVAIDEQGDAGTAMMAVSRAKARASEAAMLVTRQSVQLHGGIGYTDDCDAGLFLRKAMVLANLHGSAAQHRARFARLSAIGGTR